ncbi:hypothetical protein F2Q69_00018406 [Brassica cretica]|uniref:Uncharacterized protein n=1 Tax=Brassica cretica TaxID=69181 RepID=A0A8S9Q2Y2_BRACR|nr:hypothetical protein F2Q69_00018406 [Brassica cretica]
MAEIIAGEAMMEVAKQLVVVARKAYRCRIVASNLATMIMDLQPTINEIRSSGVTLPPHRQAQLRGRFWLYVHLLRAESDVRFSQIDLSLDSLDVQMTDVLSDVHHLQATSEARFDRTDRNFDSVSEILGAFEVRFDQIDRNFDALRTAKGQGYDADNRDRTEPSHLGE